MVGSRRRDALHQARGIERDAAVQGGQDGVHRHGRHAEADVARERSSNDAQHVAQRREQQGGAREAHLRLGQQPIEHPRRGGLDGELGRASSVSLVTQRADRGSNVRQHLIDRVRRLVQQHRERIGFVGLGARGQR